jgi:hypothetical protein
LFFHIMNEIVIHGQGRMILAHLCDEPKGLKTGMCMVCLLPVLALFLLCCIHRAQE